MRARHPWGVWCASVRRTGEGNSSGLRVRTYGHEARKHQAHGHECFFTLPGRRDSVARARHRVRAELQRRRLPADLCDVAVLVISELVTNAVLHTGGALVGCEVRVMTDHVRLDVHDQGIQDGALGPRCPDSDAESGRGLLLVDSLADSWGVVSREGGVGRTVWATLPFPA
ncbi:ATP-binding protein [Streptomyces sp. NPDC058280]|uniref:ATP-binding protein n=1 Tax=Streptomyces sp. NPDC058280 TaxID=3346419 RepID=UPI0036E14E0C